MSVCMCVCVSVCVCECVYNRVREREKEEANPDHDSNCRLNAFMSVCNTSITLQMKLLRFLCIAKINFVDTDLISLVTAQMSYNSN